jgi:hypothetical protein
MAPPVVKLLCNHSGEGTQLVSKLGLTSDFLLKQWDLPLQGDSRSMSWGYLRLHFRQFRPPYVFGPATPPSTA